jgi:MSHA biogenesis protein MshP
MKNSKNGFALISAIFLLVVIGALGLFSVTISTTQQQDSIMDLQGSRAYQAARAGIEASIYQITKSGVTTCTGFPQPTMPAGQLSTFTVTVTCSSASYTEGVDTFSVYQLTSIAKTGTLGSANYVERQLQVAIKNP